MSVKPAEDDLVLIGACTTFGGRVAVLDRASSISHPYNGAIL